MVCGSRSWSEEDGWIIRARLIELPPDATVIHGDARGADRIADLWWRIAKGRRCERFFPDYERWNKGYAPIRRNLEMLDSAPELVIAFHDGLSRGTQQVIDEARRRGIQVEIHSPAVPTERAT